MLPVVLLVFSLVLFAVAGLINPAEPWRSKLICFGLACLSGAFLFEKAPPLIK